MCMCLYMCSCACMCTCVCMCVRHILKHSLKHSRTGTHTPHVYTYYTQALTHRHTHTTCLHILYSSTHAQAHTHHMFTHIILKHSCTHVLKHLYSSKYFLKGLGPRIKPGLGSKKYHHHYSFASPAYPDVRCKMRSWLWLGMDNTLVVLYPPRFRWDFRYL